jgi:hypothetical protein
VVEGLVDGVWCSSEDHVTIVLPQTVLGSGHRAHCQAHSFPPLQVAGQPEQFSCAHQTVPALCLYQWGIQPTVSDRHKA